MIKFRSNVGRELREEVEANGTGSYPMEIHSNEFCYHKS